VTRPGELVTPEDEALVERLSDAARQSAAAQAGGYPAAGAWHRLQARREGLEGRRRRARWFVLASATAAAAVVLATRTLFPAAHPVRPLTFEVADGILEEGGYVRGDDQRGGQLRFSDGTRVRLAPGAKMSVATLGVRGARLRVQDGQAHFEVMHLPQAAWTVDAGPYVVEVTGTVFDVRWSGADEVAEIHLRSGSVRVSGPLLAEHATLHPGQSLIARIADHELRIEGNHAAVLAAPPAATAPAAASSGSPVAAAPPARAAAVEPPASSAPRPAKTPARRLALLEAPRPAPAWNTRDWTARVTGGDARAVLEEAEAHGLDAVLAQADAPALVALADAARYNGRPDLAVRALLAQRKRFPGTATAANAAFFLGRLADDNGKPGDALDWYRRYSLEQPRGAYASEALGRAMLGVARLSGKAEARTMAEEYLKRFPDGTYLLHAQQIVNSP
jgi:ferric-dicitrate binding protein FerR (iron transport regulator)